MKNWIPVLSLLTGLLAACVAIPQPVTSILPPSPTATLVISTPTVGLAWKTYENQAYGFSLRYPADFTLAELPVVPGITLWLSFTAPGDPGDPSKYEPPFALIVYANPGYQALVDWFSNHMSDSTEYGQKPTEAVAFLSPIVENQDDFQGHTALQYESGAWPVRYEKLVEQDGWVIGLYYHRDHLFDYGTAYEQVLASLQLTQPQSTPVVTPTVIPPTPVPIVCLDAQAKPLTVPPREQSLEVRFISDGNIWLWEEGAPARQVSDTRDALHFTFSPDGEVAVFERMIGSYPYDYEIELWAINRDGNDLRQLVSAEQFDQFLPGRHEAWIANLPRDYRWFSGTHQLSFGVYPFINAVGGSDAAEGYWIINVDTLELKKWDHPIVIDPYGPKKIVSPDSKIIALVDRESISLLNADGSVIRRDALTYQANSYGEGPGWGAPRVVWSPDSLTLKVVVWEGDLIAVEKFSAWEISADGSQAEKLHTFSGMEYFTSFSPNQQYIAYLHRPNPMANDNELHLAKFDGSADLIYAAGYQLYFQGWAPDSYHFVYDLFATHQPILGSICSGKSELVDKSETPATQITWVDGERFLFVVGQDEQPRQLWLGRVGGESLLLGSFNGQYVYYEITPDEQDVIVP